MSDTLDFLNRNCVMLGDAVFAALGVFSPAVGLCIISALCGAGMLLVWRYTSNQAAIADVRRQISAHLLATRLFKDNLSVTFRAQRQILWQAMRLLGHSVRPVLIMLVPFTLVMVQIGLRYELRPLPKGRPVRVKATLRSAERMYGAGDNLALQEGLRSDEHDPCRVEALRTVDWRITPNREGAFRLTFGDGANRVEMPLIVGEGFGRLSMIRGGGFWDRLLYSAEPGMPDSSIFESVWIDYPRRSTPMLGVDVHWLISFFVLSLVFALLLKPVLRVHI